MSRTIFDYLNSIFYKKYINDFNSKECPKVLLIYWISEDKSLINIANKINKQIWYLSDKMVYDYLFEYIPKGRRFIQWTKKEKGKKKESSELKEMKIKYHLTDSEIAFFNFE